MELEEKLQISKFFERGSFLWFLTILGRFYSFSNILDAIEKFCWAFYSIRSIHACFESNRIFSPRDSLSYINGQEEDILVEEFASLVWVLIWVGQLWRQSELPTSGWLPFPDDFQLPDICELPDDLQASYNYQTVEDFRPTDGQLW